MYISIFTKQNVVIFCFHVEELIVKVYYHIIVVYLQYIYNLTRCS